MEKVIVRNKFDREAVRYSTPPGTKPRVKQAFKKDCDINLIMGRYAKGQIVDHLAKWEGTYGDFPAQDFQEAMGIVAKAQEMFNDLDSAIRIRFANDPAQFLAFAQDEKNLPEMRKLGIAKPEVPAAPTAVEARVAELEADRAARLELARRAVTLPPEGAPHTSS